MAKRMAVYWDANAFQALLNRDKSDAELADTEAVWTAAQKGQVIIVTSTLTNAEVIFVKGTPKLDPAKRSLVTNFFRQPFIVQYPLTQKISELARDVVWDTPVKPKDAIHVATAAFHKIRVFHTFDGPLLTQSAIAINGYSVETRKPKWQNQLEISPDVFAAAPPAATERP
jgi:predicted nucleic acid-binding protein